MFLRTCTVRVILFVIVASALSACETSGMQSTPTIATLTAAHPSPSLPAMTTATAKPPRTSPTPTLESLGTPIEPLVTAPRILLHSWSPDGKFLAYWTFTQEEVAADYTYPPGTLNFLNIGNGQICQPPKPVGYPYSGTSPIAWQPDGRILVITAGEVLLGRPCQQDFADVTGRLPGVLGIAIASPDDTVWLLSNEKGYSLYLPETQALREVAGTVGGSNTGYSWSPGRSRLGITGALDDAKAATWVIDVQTGTVADEIEWRYRSAEGNFAGPIWLSESQLLIQATVDQGPLLLTVGQGVAPIVTKLFGVPGKPDCPDTNSCDVFRLASGATVRDTQAFHIALFDAGDTHSPQTVLLYHSESGEVERLPSSTAGFSPDGRWLIVQSSISTTQGERFQIGLRPVDPPGSETRPLIDIESSSLPLWSADSSLLVSGTPDGLTVFSADGQRVSSWTAAGYALEPGLWSPDGKYLTVRADPQSLTLPPQGEFLSAVQVR